MSRRFALILLVTFSAALAQDAPFGEGLFQVLEKAACRSCHNPDGVASATRLQFPEPDATPAKVEAFGRSLVTLIDRERADASLLLNKPTNRTPHAGGERIKTGSQDEAVLKAWVQRLTQLSGVELASALKYREEEAAGAGTARVRVDLRRLTHSQYNNTVRDLLGDQTAPANQFPPEDFVNGFRNQYQAQRSVAAADRGLQRRGGEAGAQRVPRRRHARADSLQTFSRLPHALRSRVRA